MHILTVRLDYHVAGLEPCIVRGAVFNHFKNQHALATPHAEVGAEVSRNVPNLNAYVTALTEVDLLESPHAHHPPRRSRSQALPLPYSPPDPSHGGAVDFDDHIALLEARDVSGAAVN